MAKNKDCKKVIGVMITDDHLAEDNCELILSIHRQARQKAIEHKLDGVYHGGDLIDSRKAQSWPILRTMIQLCREYEEDELELRIIPGNHDKPNYESEESFLDVFDKYPAFELVRTVGTWMHDDIAITMVPYFKEDTTYSKYLNQVPQHKKHILITHIAVTGVQNNDKSLIENSLTKDLFKDFKLVLVGHYHNQQTIDNIKYVGSTHQHNFGEDDRKGITLIWDDCTITQQPLDTPKFTTNYIDLNTISQEQLEQHVETIKSTGNFEKIKFTGTKEKLISFDKILKKVESDGIKVDRTVDDPEVDLSYTELINFKGFNNQTIKDEWDLFCKAKNVDKTIAKSLKNKLNKILS